MITNSTAPVAEATPSDTHGLVHVSTVLGHRGEYQELFAGIFGLAPSAGRVTFRNLPTLCAAPRLLFATLDDDLRGFVLTALLRSCLGRRTAGVFLRPQSCLGGGLRTTAKRLIFRALRRLPGAATVSIIPFAFLPGSERVATHGIHDPQLWDDLDRADPPDPETLAAIRQLAAGRPVLAFLGRVSPIKGFAQLAAVVDARPDLLQTYAVLVAGVVDPACHDAATRLAAQGAILWDRRLTEAEMAAVYIGAHLIWACYDPGYDQASGIFGRAVQRARMAVIREGAMIGRYAAMLAHPCVPLPADPVEAARRLSEAVAPAAHPAATPPGPTLLRWREQSIETLRAVL